VGLKPQNFQVIPAIVPVQNHPNPVFACFLNKKKQFSIYANCKARKVNGGVKDSTI
jgi:hypothetical protein